MSEVATLIADMVRAGVDPDLIGRAAAAIAETAATPKTARQLRNHRYYEAKVSERRLKASEQDVSDGDALPPKESPQTLKETPPFQPTTQQEKTLRVQKKASRLPADWVLPVDWRADALAVGLPESVIDLEASKMLDWSRSSKNGAKFDWRAVWRNWCREAVQRRPNARGSPSKPRTAADFLFAETMESLNGNARQDGPETVNWPDAGEFPSVTVSGPARRLGIPRDG